MNDNKEDLLNELENAYAYLSEDTQALFFIIDEYFSSYVIRDDFSLTYPIIQNSLFTLFKSMMLNELNIKEVLTRNTVK